MMGNQNALGFVPSSEFRKKVGRRAATMRKSTTAGQIIQKQIERKHPWRQNYPV